MESQTDLSPFHGGNDFKPQSCLLNFCDDTFSVLCVATSVNVNALEPSQFVGASKPTVLRCLQLHTCVDTQELHASRCPTLQRLEHRSNELLAKFKYIGLVGTCLIAVDNSEDVVRLVGELI